MCGIFVAQAVAEMDPVQAIVASAVADSVEASPAQPRSASESVADAVLIDVQLEATIPNPPSMETSPADAAAVTATSDVDASRVSPLATPGPAHTAEEGEEKEDAALASHDA